MLYLQDSTIEFKNASMTAKLAKLQTKAKQSDRTSENKQKCLDKLQASLLILNACSPQKI